MQLEELWNLALAIFQTDDWVKLVIIAVIIIAGGFFMQSFGQILNVTALGLVVYVVTQMVRDMMAPQAPAFDVLAQQYWDAFLAMDVKTLLVWFLTFGILIFIVYFIRSLVMRG